MKEFNTLKDLVSFNTIKDKENNKIIDYIEKMLIKLGFNTEYKSRCLVMSIGENPKLGFLGHTDTVNYSDDFKDPFNIKIKEDKIYGLGVCDMKGGIAAMLDAISKIDFSKLKYGMKLYFSFDEEIGFKGINELVNRKEKFPEYVILGEPTDNEIYVGSKGLMEYNIKFIGKKAHSSYPNKGISANLNAVKFIYELNDFYEKEIKCNEDSRFEIPYTTLNVGIINGGADNNSISDNCDITIDFRTVNRIQNLIISNKIKELSKIYMANILNVEDIEPFIDKCDFADNAKTTNYITEASMIKDSKRIILGLGPITAHEINECISIESYNKLIEQYTELIYKILN